MKSTLLVLLVLLASTVARADIDDAMLLFGRSFLPADKVVNNGMNDPASVSDDDLRAVFPGLDSVIDTSAQMIPDDCPADMLPPKANGMPEPQRSQYLAKFHALMTRFHDSVVKYKELFQAQLALKSGGRDFNTLHDQRQNVLDIATEAHGALQ